jgi:hypothetical protein
MGRLQVFNQPAFGISHRDWNENETGMRAEARLLSAQGKDE